MSMQREFFTIPFLRLLIAYSIAFITFYILYTAFNWFLVVKLHVGLSSDMLDYWIPFVMGGVITYIFLRPIVKQLTIREKAKDALNWAVLPLTLGIAVAFSQGYFKDKSYTVITVEKPSDVLKYPHERYFQIKKYYIQPRHFFCVNEEHTVGRNGTTLVYAKDITLPMYDDSTQQYGTAKIAYGICFDTSMHNGLLDKNEQPPIIAYFNRVADTEYRNYNFYTPSFFVKENLYDEKYFKKSWQNNSYLDKNGTPIVLMGKSGALLDIYDTEWSRLKYGTTISFGFAILIIFLIQLWNVYDLYAD